MKDISRREFLSQTLLSVSSLIAISPAIYANDEMRRKNSLMLAECAIVYKAWNKKEDIMPARYFVSSMKRYGLDPWAISDAARLDFQHHNYFVVKGLQLSKTEAAFLALLGEKSAIN